MKYKLLSDHINSNGTVLQKGEIVEVNKDNLKRFQNKLISPKVNDASLTDTAELQRQLKVHVSNEKSLKDEIKAAKNEVKAVIKEKKQITSNAYDFLGSLIGRIEHNNDNLSVISDIENKMKDFDESDS